MKLNSFLKLKHMAWAAGALVAAILVNVVARSGAKASVQAPSAPVVQVAAVEEKDVPVYGEWIGTLTGQVNADVKAQVTGYLLKRNYEEGSYVRKGQFLFEIDPRPLQAALDQAKGQLEQSQAHLIQDEAQLATAEANQLKSQLDFEKYAPLAKVDAVSQQDLDNANQTDLANRAQVKAAEAAIASAHAQIHASQAAVETAAINLNFTRIVSPIDGIAGIAQAQVGDLVSTSSGVLTTVSTVDPIRDYFSVSEQEYLALQKQFSGSTKDRWKLQLILADGSTYSHEGEFYFADRQVNQNTGAIELAALFPNPGNVLRPGEYGKVRAVVHTQQNALLIPQAVASDYFLLRDLDLQLQITQDTVRTQEDSVKLTQLRLEHGIATTLDVLQARQVLDIANAQIPDLERQIGQTEDAITILLGKYPDSVPRGEALGIGTPEGWTWSENLSPQLPAGLPSELLERRPDIREAEQTLVAANANIGVAKAMFFPQISLLGSGGAAFGHRQFPGSHIPAPLGVGTYAAAASQPLFEGGALRNNLRYARSEERQALVGYQQTIQRAFGDVSDSLIGYDKYHSVRERQERSVKDLQESVNVSLMRYNGGTATYLSVLDSQRSLFAAELTLAQARNNEYQSLVQLYKALGGGWK